jgi:hypothetical protein
MMKAYQTAAALVLTAPNRLRLHYLSNIGSINGTMGW